ncbi:MAG: RNA 3'-terminal phosphate cyclase [Archaeoglobaceae archaeon]|nr:RNA 3'-terminal phosphate cyclase [Archaeoglobaceae archaeon]MDW7990285.1 RNA 3'-terminal phosphate cyclase [Archaeoglobaceae archaeon]
MLRIDGSFGEGGGQILRSAIALSCITGIAVEIDNIRANRPNPGLASQHLKGIEVAKLISDAEVEGLKLGSKKVIFKPKKIRGGEYKIDIGTAGSVILILQSILPPLLIAERKSRLEIIGGTDVAWAPTVDYFKNVTMRAIVEMGCKISLKLKNRGYYPRGGGKITVEIEPSKLSGKNFEKIDCEIRGISHCQNLPEHVALRQRDSLIGFLNERGLNAEIEVEFLRGLSTGSGITLWCGYKGGSALGEKGKKAEEVGIEAGKNFYEEFVSDGVFDSYLADQIMIFSAMARGVTEFTTTEITMHQKSNRYVINSFFGEVVNLEEKKRKIEIKGRDF